MKCPLCETKLKNQLDKYYYSCDTCRAVVMDQKNYLTQEEEKNRYLEHNNDVNDKRYQEFTSPITNYVLKYYTTKHRGLDFGSGTGPVITKMLEDRNYRIEKYDPYFAPNDKVLLKKYDYVVSCEVFEHFHKPKKEIEQIYNLLKENGRLILLTVLYNDNIEFKNWYYRNDPTHIFIYRKETINFVADNFGFEIEFLSDRLICLIKPNILV
jgi:SAM-dependent methyltransferase